MIRTGSVILLLFLFSAVVSVANEAGVSFEMKTNKSQYYEFEFIYLKYVVKNGRPQNVKPPVIEGVKVVDSGVEQTSGGMSITFNGQNIQKQHQQQSYVITFALQPTKTGRINIPNTTILIDGKEYSEKGFSVYVSPLSISDSQLKQDRFVKVEVSNYKPFVGEALTVSYMLFTRDALSEETQMKTQKFINFGDFTVKSIGDFKASRIQLKGQNYYMVELQSHLITPLTSGKKTIPSHEIEYVTYQVVQEGFFGRRVAVDRKVDAPSFSIDVQALPKAPSGFSGLVGDFKMELKVDKEEVLLNDAITIKYYLKGVGHFDALDNFQVNLPDSWELFDPKRIDNTAPGLQGMSGSLVYEYVAIPRQAGKYELPRPELVCFNPKKEQYYSVLPDAKYIGVEGSSDGIEENQIVSSVSGKQAVEMRSQDIRYLKTDFELKKREFGENWPIGLTSAIIGLSVINLGAILWPLIIGLNKDCNQRRTNINADFYKRVEKLTHKEGVSGINTLMSEYWTKVWGLAISDQNTEAILEMLSNKGVVEEKIKIIRATLKDLTFAAYAKGAVEFDELKRKVLETIEILKNEI